MPKSNFKVCNSELGSRKDSSEGYNSDCSTQAGDADH